MTTATGGAAGLDLVPFVLRAPGTLLVMGRGAGATARHLRDTGRAERVGAYDDVAPSLSEPELDFYEQVDLDSAPAIAAALERWSPFATICSIDVVQRVPDPWKLVELLHDALQPGGRIVAAVPHARAEQVSGREQLAGLMSHSGLRLEGEFSPEHRRLKRALRGLGAARFEDRLARRHVVRLRRID